MSNDSTLISLFISDKSGFLAGDNINSVYLFILLDTCGLSETLKWELHCMVNNLSRNALDYLQLILFIVQN